MKLIAEHARQIAELKAKLPKEERMKIIQEEEKKRGVVDKTFLREGSQVRAD